MKSEEIKGLNDSELIEKIESEAAAYHQMVLNHAVTPVQNPAAIKQLRRTIAQLKTEQRRRELSK